MSAELLTGLEVILVVTVMSMVVSPILLWVLPDRLHNIDNTRTA